MMALFYFGCAVSLTAAGLAPTTLMLATAMGLLGTCAAIYHPVGMAMLIDISRARPRTLAFNGVCGNLGVTLAAGISTTLAAPREYFKIADNSRGVTCVCGCSSPARVLQKWINSIRFVLKKENYFDQSSFSHAAAMRSAA